MADPQEQKWYKMEVGGKWYKTQAASMDEARSVINGQASSGSNRPVPPVPRPDSPLNYAVPGSDLLGGLTGYFPTRTPRNGPGQQLPSVAPLEMAQGMLSGTMPQSETEFIPGAGKGVSATRNLATPGKRVRGAAQAIEAVGDVAAPLIGPEASNIAAAGGEAIGPALKLGAGLGAGLGTQKGAEYTAKRLGASPDTQELVSQAGFWIPTIFGMVWSGSRGTPAPENPAVTPSGKTELEAKAETKREPPTPTPTPEAKPTPPAPPETQEQMNARIARNEARIAKGGTPTPEKPDKMNPVERTLWQEGAFKEKPLEDTTDKVRKPELTRAETADIQVRKQAEALRRPAPPEVRPGDAEYQRVKDRIDQLNKQITSPARQAETKQTIDDAYKKQGDVLNVASQLVGRQFDEAGIRKWFPLEKGDILDAAAKRGVSETQLQELAGDPGTRKQVQAITNDAYRVQLQKLEASGAIKQVGDRWEITAGRETPLPKGTAENLKIRGFVDRFKDLRGQGLSEPEQIFQLLKEYPENADEITRAFKTPISAKMGGEPSVPEAAKPADQPVQAAAPPERSREPVRPAEVPKVSEPTPAPRTPFSAEGDFKKRLEMQKAMVEAEMAKPENKGVPKAEIQRRISERINKERGTLGGSEPEDRQARREEKLKPWLDILRNPYKQGAEVTDAWNQLLKMGLSQKDIIQRMAGAEGFAKTPEEAKQEAWEKFSNPEEPRSLIESGMAKTEGLRPSEEAKAQSNELDVIKKEMENLRKQIDAEKTKDPGVQELNKLASLEDKRSELESIAKTGEERDISELKRMFDLKDERGFWRMMPSKKIKGAPPVKASPLSLIGDVIDRFATLGGLLEKSPEEMKARNITRGFAANLRLAHLQLEAKLRDFLESHDTDGKAEFRAFMDAGEAKPGAQFLKPTDQFVASTLKDMLNERWQKVQNYLGKDPDAGIDNYLGRLWKKRPGDVIGQYFGRSPIAGRGGFLKPRFYEYASDALDAGKEPITWNPVRMQLTALFQMDKWLAAHELKDMYKDAGIVQFFRNSQTKPDGWHPLNDSIFNPKLMEGPGKLVEWGKYFAPPDVAKIFNRYVAPGLRGDPTYDAVRTYGNLLNQINLGVSAYHGSFITLVSAASDVANGLERVVNNHDIGGFKDMFRGTVGTLIGASARADYKLGRAIQEEAIRPTGNPHLQAFVQDLVKQGATFDQDPMYETNARKFFTELQSGHPIKAIQSGVQTLSKPIMKYYVPRVKLGMAARMMETKMDYLIKNNIMDKDIQANEMSKIWDSVDNRAGQMVYDNLFWNKTAKDLSFLTIRAVGWDYGSAREFGGAAKDTLTQAANILRGEKAPLSSRQAFVVGTVMTVGTLGAISHYLATGRAPSKLEDYFYPETGKIGPNGKPERVSFPSYMKDVFSMLHDAQNLKVDTAIHKLHPAVNQIVEFLQNKDFYGTEIRSEGDPALKQGLQTLGWYGKSFAPFSFTMAQQRAKAGIPKIEAYGESMLGIQRAPAYVTQTKAEELALDFAKRNWKAGPLTTEEREQRDNFNEFRSKMAMGQKVTAKELNQAVTDGKITHTDIDRLYKEKALGYTTLQSDFKALNIPEALKVYQSATPEERAQLKRLLYEKQDKLGNMVPEQQSFYFKKIHEAITQ